MAPDDLLTMVLAVAQARFLAAEGDGADTSGTQTWTKERLASHRAAVVEAARRISEPRGAAA
ncbi:hypothetical protein [Streptomyces violaceusniger]|uniref:Uncharacterized protein n=1 Tax=Streptomyces violaceusniger TaxID=68280 RepID=A0A4D4L0A4_STRVO|nr:hypothetical protein SVIO_028830 [Streptomyces violaceusniger]